MTTMHIVDVKVSKIGFFNREKGLPSRSGPKLLPHPSWRTITSTKHPTLSSVNNSTRPCRYHTKRAAVRYPWRYLLPHFGRCLGFLLGGAHDLTKPYWNAQKKARQDRRTDDAIAEAQKVIEGWNERFRANYVPSKIRLKGIVLQRARG